MMVNNGNYVSDFERYMYIIPMKIEKLCPHLAHDEDLLHDCYLELLEFTQNNKSFNNCMDSSRRTTLVHTRISNFIKRTLKRREDDIEVLAGFNLQNKEFGDIEEIVFKNDLSERMEEVLDLLTDRESDVLRIRFNMYDNYTRTLEDVGQIFNATRERIRQIENKAIRKLRHPSRAKKIKDYYA